MTKEQMNELQGLVDQIGDLDDYDVVEAVSELGASGVIFELENDDQVEGARRILKWIIEAKG